MADVIPIPTMGASGFRRACADAIKALKRNDDALVITFFSAAPASDGSRMLEVNISTRINDRKVLLKSALMKEDLMLKRIFPVYGEAGRESEILEYLKKNLRLQIKIKKPAALALQKLDFYPIPSGDEMQTAKAVIRWDEIKENLLSGITEDIIIISFSRRMRAERAPAKQHKRLPILKMR